MPAACPALDSRLRTRVEQDYTALHEGLPPRVLTCDVIKDPPSQAQQDALGRMTEIQYYKLIPREKNARFHHPFAVYAQPMLVVDRRDGSLVILTGRYETTRRGIEDRVLPGMPTEGFTRHPYVGRESAPAAQSPLTTLGKLQWIKYKGLDDAADAPVRRLVFPAHIAPELAHDAHGNLHILPARYVITDRGVEPMAHQSNSMMQYDNPSHGRRRSGGRRRRANGRYMNPSSARSRRSVTRVSYSSMQPTSNGDAYSMILSSLLVGGVAVLTAVGMDMVLGAFLPVSVTAPWRAGIKIVAGLGVGFGLAMALKGNDNKWLKTIPAGVAVGGTFSGLSNLYALYVAPLLMPQSTVVTTTVTPGAGMGTTPPTSPAGQALLPGTYGVPSGYGVYNRQACAVPGVVY